MFVMRIGYPEWNIWYGDVGLDTVVGFNVSKSAFNEIIDE